MATFLKVVAVSVALVMGVSVTVVAAPVAATAAAEEPVLSTALVAAVSAVGANEADLLSVPVDLLSVVADQAGGTMAKAAVRKKDARKAAAKRVAATGCSTAAKHKSGNKRPSCEPLNKFLTWFYQMAWRLAMHTPDTKRAFGVFVIARRHAAQVVAAKPGAKPVVVCNVLDIERRVLPLEMEIMRKARDAKLRLPPPCMYRQMTRAEMAAMRKALAVPLTKPLPSWAVPKTVPMFI